MPNNSSLVDKYLYKSPYVEDIQKFKEDIFQKKVIPYQVEIQPGPLGTKLCWLNCPYCYGKSAINSPERLTIERYIQVINEIMDGGCKKLIFAGWATDPLFYKYIDDLVETAVTRNAIVGFNTRALKINERLIELITRPDITKTSYISISVNAGNNTNYNKVNGVRNKKAKLYDKAVDNVRKIAQQQRKNNASLDISVSYLLNQYTHSKEEVLKFIADFKGAGVNLIRFSSPQIPRGDLLQENSFIPTTEEYQFYVKGLEKIIKDANTEECNVIIIDNNDNYLKARTTPCFARFIYPTIGYDGWLYHCSQSSGSNFRSQALGNLAINNFWDLFYDYDANNLDKYFERCSLKMESNNCRCDRKEHTVNAMMCGNK